MDNLKRLFEDNRDKPRRYGISGAAKDEAEVYLYDAIGGFYGIDAGKFAKDLKAIKASTIHLRINSPGGDSFAARAIAMAIMEHPATVIAHIDGVAASAASFVMLSASKIVASDAAFVMVHNPWSLTIGDADEHVKIADLLSKVQYSMASDYAKRSGKTTEEAQAWMDAETWFTAEEAKQAGLVDEVVESVATTQNAAASIRNWNLAAYQNAPAALVDVLAQTNDVQGSAPDKPEKEVSLMENPDVTPQGQNQAPDLEAIRAEERRRISEIQRIGAAAHMSAEQIAAAIDNATTVQSFRERAFDAMLAQASTHETRVGVAVTADGTDKRRDAMTAAILNRISSSAYNVDNQNPYRQMSCLRMAEEALAESGVKVRGMAPAEIAIKAMHSTSDFPYILENTARKRLLDSYSLQNPTYKIWTAASSTPDFKTMSRTRLGEAPTFELVPDGGEIKLGTMAESREQYAIATYGKGISFTRQMLINDDLGAFNNLIGAFGAQAARLENKTVYAILTANANMADGNALFVAGHSNTGTGVIGNTALDAMFVAMRTQKGLDGVSILNIVPRYLIVPASKEATANAAMVNVGPSVKAADQNWFAGRLQVVADGELDATSTVVWYGAADPSILPGIEYSYLEGAVGPQIVRKENEGGVLGVTLYAFLDFGAKAVDWRPLYHSTGA